jgi:hypothetical protein
MAESSSFDHDDLIDADNGMGEDAVSGTSLRPVAIFAPRDEIWTPKVEVNP